MHLKKNHENYIIFYLNFFLTYTLEKYCPISTNEYILLQARGGNDWEISFNTIPELLHA